jgi:hypothetical protein
MGRLVDDDDDDDEDADDRDDDEDTGERLSSLKTDPLVVDVAAWHFIFIVPVSPLDELDVF